MHHIIGASRNSYRLLRNRMTCVCRWISQYICLGNSTRTSGSSSPLMKAISKSICLKCHFSVQKLPEKVSQPCNQLPVQSYHSSYLCPHCHTQLVELCILRQTCRHASSFLTKIWSGEHFSLLDGSLLPNILIFLMR